MNVLEEGGHDSLLGLVLACGEGGVVERGDWVGEDEAREGEDGDTDGSHGSGGGGACVGVVLRSGPNYVFEVWMRAGI